jgi:signal transduction histidine kinase/CheY-like chemotaxis protein/HPt (histidine-containing phosphotransfer) domain-containing protein
MGRRAPLVAPVVALVFIALALLQYHYFPAHQERTLSAALRAKATAIAELTAHDIRPGIDFDDKELVREVFAGAAADPDLRYVVAYDQQGAVFVAHDPANLAPRTAPAMQGATLATLASGILRVEAPIVSPAGSRAMLVAGFSTAGVERESLRNRRVALLIGLAIIGLGLATAVWIGLAIQRMARLASAAEAASRAKSQFLANMSHEIRTPMNGVLGLIDLMLRTRLDGRQRRYARQIEASGETLLGIINDVLDFSKIEAGKLEIEAAPFDLGERIEDLVSHFAAQAAAKRLELVVMIDPKLPAVIQGDSLRIQQILNNLVGNAIKFTGAGHVAVRVRCSPGEAGQVQVQIEVEDSGIGIPIEAQQKLFRPFVQADTSMTRRYGGTGLGLVIARQLAELMHGAITVRSEPGRGSTFTLAVPLSVAPSEAPPPTPPPESPLGRVLVVDDSDVARNAVAEALQAWGWRVSEAADGSAALEWIQSRLSSGEPLDLVVSDVGMPELDGLALTRALRSDPTSATLPVILMAPPDQDEYAIFADAGASATLTKPVRRSALRSAVDQARGVGDASPVTAAPAKPADERRRKPRRRHGTPVLVVEDNETNREVLVALLDHLGYRPDVARNGNEALRLLMRQHPYRIVLMDCQMPEMDGYTAATHWRQWEQEHNLARLPIVAVTAHALSDDKEKVMRSGMDDYVTKPVREVMLATVLERWARAPTPPATRPAGPVPQESPSGGLLDEETWAGLQRLQTPRRPKFLASIVERFLHDAEGHTRELRAALEAEETERLRTTGHTLKGSARTIGAQRLAFVCEQIQHAEIADAAALVDAAQKELADVRPVLLEALSKSRAQADADAPPEPPAAS